jgi:hypothetical protein
MVCLPNVCEFIILWTQAVMAYVKLFENVCGLVE